MKTTVSLSDFRQAFRDFDRLDNFSYEGLGVLFDYLEEYEESTGEEIELDVIALCCDYSEDTPLDIAENYDIDLSDADDEGDMDANKVKKIVLAYLNDNTSVVGETDTTIVYACF